MDCNQMFHKKYKNDLLPTCGEQLYSFLRYEDETSHIYQDISNADYPRVRDPDLEELEDEEDDGYLKSKKDTKNIYPVLKPRDQTKQVKDKRVAEKISSLSISDFRLINQLGSGTFGLVIGARYNKGCFEIISGDQESFVALKVMKKIGILDYGLPSDILNWAL